MRRLFLMLMVLALLAGCKTQERIVAVTDYRTDTLLTMKLVRDSVWLMDSVFVREFAHHDTIYTETTRWRTKTVERLRIDTVYQSVKDSTKAEVVIIEKRTPTSRTVLVASIISVAMLLAMAFAVRWIKR